MIINAESEQLLSFAEAAKLFPGKQINPSTVYRWATKGARGHKLATICIGGRRFTSREAVRKWLEAQNAGNDGASLASGMSRQCRERQIRQAEEELNRHGIPFDSSGS